MKKKSFKGFLRCALTDDEISRVYSSYDIIGDIAIIKVPRDLMMKRHEIAEAIHLFTNSRIVTMVSGKTDGVNRTRPLEILYGDDKNKTETIHKESGCSFKLDVREVFFSPRLSYERKRIAGLVKPDEKIINIFAGVGTYSIIIAKRCPNVKIYSIDINPIAFRYMLYNIKMNGVEESVIPILGDARKILSKKSMSNVNFDRIIMSLPDIAYSFIDLAFSHIKSNGVIHYYDVVYGVHGIHGNDKEKLYKEPIAKIEEMAMRFNIDIEIENRRIVREVGPRKYHIVLDVRVKY